MLDFEQINGMLLLKVVCIHICDWFILETKVECVIYITVKNEHE